MRTLVSLAAAATIALLAALPAAAQSNDGRDRRVRIINATDYIITHFYASNSGRESWEEDILGADVLPAGRTVLINIDDGTGACLYDFKATFEDGDEATKFGVNVCQISEFTFTD